MRISVHLMGTTIYCSAESLTGLLIKLNGMNIAMDEERTTNQKSQYRESATHIYNER